MMQFVEKQHILTLKALNLFREDLILALFARLFISLKLCIANNTTPLGYNVVYYIVVKKLLVMFC